MVLNFHGREWWGGRGTWGMCTDAHWWILKDKKVQKHCLDGSKCSETIINMDSWPSNNRGLKCMDPLIHVFLWMNTHSVLHIPPFCILEVNQQQRENTVFCPQLGICGWQRANCMHHSTSFYKRDLSTRGFWYWQGSLGTNLLRMPRANCSWVWGQSKVPCGFLTAWETRTPNPSAFKCQLYSDAFFSYQFQFIEVSLSRPALPWELRKLSF